MQEGLKELNKVIKPKLEPKQQKVALGKVLKKIGLLMMIVIFFFSAVYSIPYLGNALKREIFIAAQGQTMGLVFPSALSPGSRVNLLFAGIPGQGYNGENMTDTIIIINSGPKGESPVGFSIPRDLLVKFPQQNYYTKINALYGSSEDKKEGIRLLESAIKEVTGLNIDYYFVFDLNGVKNIIDALGGIDVTVQNDIYDPKFPAPYDSYETFSLKRGVHHLDGETALKYLRSRNNPEGDFSRIKRQQEVLNILKNKITALNFVWDFPTILSLWKNFNSHTSTDIDITDIKYAWNLVSKTDFDTIKFTTLDMEENRLLINDSMLLGGINAYILKPIAGIDDFSQIKNFISGFIGQNTVQN